MQHSLFLVFGKKKLADESTKRRLFHHQRSFLENLFEQLGIHEDIHYQTVTEIKEMHPGRTAAIYLGEQFIGFVGQVHPTTAKVMIFQKHM